MHSHKIKFNICNTFNLL